MPVDRDLWNHLLTGINTIDVEKSTTEELAISSNIDPDRMTASKYVSLSPEDWESSPQYQIPAAEGVYSDYLVAFLAEFTRVVGDISIDRLVPLSPSAWLSPATTSAYVGRDGIAIAFGSPPRPGVSNVTIDTDKILDELLLPHLEGKSYKSSGPSSLLRFIYDDEHYVMIKGNGNVVRSSVLGNPSFVIFERRYHAFWENFGVFRGYGDGTSTRVHFQLVEFFGDISASNFTKEKSKARARLYASLWATASISGQGPFVPPLSPYNCPPEHGRRLSKV